MTRWMPFVVSLALVAFGWAADRALTQVAMEVGAFPEHTDRLIVASLAARLVLAAGAVGLGWLVLRRPTDRLVGAAVLTVGLYLAAALTLSLAILRGSPLLPLSIETYTGALLRWAGTIVAVAGLVMVARPRPASPSGRSPTRSWWPVVASLAAIGVGFPAVAVTREAFIGLATGDFTGPLIVEASVRFGLVLALLAVGWLVVAGPRSRIGGAAMLAAGLYVAVLLPLAAAWFWMGDPTAGDVRQPLRLPLGVDPTDPTATASHPLGATVIALIGLATVLWPTPSRSVSGRSAAGEDRPGAAQVVEP